MKHIPLVGPGQGRSARSVRSDAGYLGWLLLLAVYLLVLLLVKAAK